MRSEKQHKTIVYKNCDVSKLKYLIVGDVVSNTFGYVYLY